MRTKIIVILSFAFSISVVSSASIAPEKEAAVEATFSSMPLSFTQNQGQWPDSILYRASAGGATMWFTPTGTYYQFTRRIPKADEGLDLLSHPRPLEKMGKRPDPVEISMVKAEFVGSNLNASAMGISEMEYKCNYFIGNEPDKWRTDVPNYEAIQYHEVYPGIDLKYYGNGKQMEYDFVVSPGADYSKIQIHYEGAESLTIGENSELIIKLTNGEIIEQPPIVHQLINGEKVKIEGKFFLGANNTFSFKVDSRYNPDHELVIDPVLVYSTYLGGSGAEISFGTADIALDATGEACVIGSTASADFPTLNPYQTDQGGDDVFVTKLSNDGNSLVYSTYLGGSGQDDSRKIAFDTAGNTYVVGRTTSSNFPIGNPYQSNLQGIADAFVTKLSSDGNTIIYSTYLGGTAEDDGHGVAVDIAGNAYVTGVAFSGDFPIANAYDVSFNGGTYDAFVSKLSSSGSSLIYSTYLGGNSIEDGRRIAIDTAGNAYVTGYTYSSNFPTANPYQSSLNGVVDVFVTKLSSGGNSLIYSTYLGGTGSDEGVAIAVDMSSNAYVTGWTPSGDFPTVFPYDGSFNGVLDAFAVKLSDAGNSLVYSTYLGGSDEEKGYGIAVDADGATYVTGYTLSTNFPTLNPYQSTHQGISDVFVTKLSIDGNSIDYSTYLGGSDYEEAWGIAVDAAGAAFVTGQTSSTNFPTLNPYQTNQGGSDVFITKLIDSCCAGNRGDVNGDGSDANILDLTFLVDRIFRGGPPAGCPKEADVNSDSATSNILDLTYLVDRIFRGGPPPGAC